MIVRMYVLSKKFVYLYRRDACLLLLCEFNQTYVPDTIYEGLVYWKV